MRFYVPVREYLWPVFMLEIVPTALTCRIFFFPTQARTRSGYQVAALGTLVCATDATTVIVPELDILGENFVKLDFQRLPGRDIRPALLLFGFDGLGLRTNRFHSLT